jgi:uncharacterized protein (DUF58 family)
MPDHRPYLDPPTLDRIKRLDVRARLVVEGFISGQHRSPYHGCAVEFAAHREYVPGDDLRHIDWKVWSRSDRLYIKEYEEETNLQCTLLVDCSRSMRYGGSWRKFDYAATAAASLAYLLARQQDAVGLVTFADRVQQSLAPRAHPSQLKLLVHELENATLEEATDAEQVFPRLAEQIERRGIVVLLSDLFMPLAVLAQSLKAFRLRRHEVMVFHVLHDDELVFPFREHTLFRGLESPVELATDARALRRSYLAAVDQFLADARRTCAAVGVDYVLMNTGQPLDAVLGTYLAFRRKVRRTAKHF